MGIVLFFAAHLLGIGFLIPALLHLCVDGVRYRDFSRRLNETLFDGAYALDVYCNVTYCALLNAFFIQKGGYHYGKQGESVSSATGKNWTIGKLTVMGEGLCGFLNMLDSAHCYKYIEGPWPSYPMPAPVAWWKTALFLIVFILLFSASMWLNWWLFRLVAGLVVG